MKHNYNKQKSNLFNKLNNINTAKNTMEGIFTNIEDKYSSVKNFKDGVFNSSEVRNESKESKINQLTSEVYLEVMRQLLGRGICFNYKLECGKEYLPYLEVVKPNNLINLIKVIEDSKCEPMNLQVIKQVEGIEVLSYSYKLEDIEEVVLKVK